MSADNNIPVAVTSGIRVQVESKFIPENSDPDIPRYFFAYFVTISNESKSIIKLIDRHWEITDAHGNLEIVDGEGVVGRQPLLKPGESFTYNSFCPLITEFGMMTGHYQMKMEDDNIVKVLIPAFKLISPFAIN